MTVRPELQGNSVGGNDHRHRGVRSCSRARSWFEGAHVWSGRSQASWSSPWCGFHL